MPPRQSQPASHSTPNPRSCLNMASQSQSHFFNRAPSSPSVPTAVSKSQSQPKPHQPPRSLPAEAGPPPSGPVWVFLWPTPSTPVRSQVLPLSFLSPSASGPSGHFCGSSPPLVRPSPASTSVHSSASSSHFSSREMLYCPLNHRPRSASRHRTESNGCVAASFATARPHTGQRPASAALAVGARATSAAHSGRRAHSSGTVIEISRLVGGPSASSPFSPASTNGAASVMRVRLSPPVRPAPSVPPGPPPVNAAAIRVAHSTHTTQSPAFTTASQPTESKSSGPDSRYASA